MIQSDPGFVSPFRSDPIRSWFFQRPPVVIISTSFPLLRRFQTIVGPYLRIYLVWQTSFLFLFLLFLKFIFSRFTACMYMQKWTFFVTHLIMKISLFRVRTKETFQFSAWSSEPWQNSCSHQAVGGLDVTFQHLFCYLFCFLGFQIYVKTTVVFSMRSQSSVTFLSFMSCWMKYW